MKYTLVTIAGIHTEIAVARGIGVYTVGVLHALFPSDAELDAWSQKKYKKWIADNNKRMKAICKFLNENNL